MSTYRIELHKRDGTVKLLRTCNGARAEARWEARLLNNGKFKDAGTVIEAWGLGPRYKWQPQANPRAYVGVFAQTWAALIRHRRRIAKLQREARRVHR